MTDTWCIENDFAAQRELAVIEEARSFREIEKLRAQLAASEQRLKVMEDALKEIADGRGIVPDKSTIYMNGRTPEVPTIFNKHDMQEVAKRALEATCQKK